MVSDALTRLVPQQASPELATGLWSLAHGLAFLHLDGTYRPEAFDEVAARVQAAATAVFGLNAG